MTELTTEPAARGALAATDLDAHEKILERALVWARSGAGAALATVVDTWGSAPRRPGAQLAISGEAALMGSVSGGCVEAAVATEALEAIADGAPRLLEFGVSDDDAFAVGLACGGVIRVLVDPVRAEPEAARLSIADLERLAAAREAREAIGYAVDLESWERRFVAPGDAPAAFAADRSARLGAEGDGPFLTVLNPPLRFLLVGAAHISQALAPMATLAGYDVFVADPRGAFATPERFPWLAADRLAADWPQAMIDKIGLDARTAVACLTHDPKIDDPALLAALPSPAFYVGALGSTRTHAKRRERLLGAGLEAGALDRLHAPIGADIGAASPAEIAVAILAQTTERLRRPETRPDAPTPGAESEAA